MIDKDCNPSLETMINQAFSNDYPGNKFAYEKRAEEKAQLLKGINERADMPGKGIEGQINLSLTLDDLLKDSSSFQQNISDFIASKFNGKFQYTQRFESLINYINHKYKANISTEFLKKFQNKDADRRRLELLKFMHSELNGSGKSMIKIAAEFGVDVKTIREDFNRLEKDFAFLDTEININGFDKNNNIHNSPVHPVFLALNSTQLYSLLFALKVMTNGTVLEDTSLSIANSIYSQLSELGENLVSDIYQASDLPEGFKKQFVGSEVIFKEMGKQVIIHAAAYKIECTISYLDGDKKVKVSGIPKINPENEYNSFILTTPNDSLIIKGSDVMEAF